MNRLAVITVLVTVSSLLTDAHVSGEISTSRWTGGGRAPAVHLLAGRQATVADSAEARGLELVSTEAVVASRGHDSWTYRWTLVVRNPEAHAQAFQARITFLDEGDHALEEQTARHLRVTSNATETFSGSCRIERRTAVAIAAVRVEIVGS